MDFNQVKFFLALANTLNFTRAAEQCHVSQPALTQAIRRLEEQLGGKLIVRNGRNNELSELGRAIKEHCEQIDRTKQLVYSTAKATVSKGKLEFNLGVMCTIGPQRVTHLFNQFRRVNPRISIILHDVTPQSVETSILSGALDAVICSPSNVAVAQLNYHHLYKEKMVVAFHKQHSFAQRETVSLNELGEENYIDRLHCEFRDTFLSFCEEQKVELNIAFRSQREDWIQSLIENGLGVCVLPEYSILSSEIASKPLEQKYVSRDIALAYVQDNTKSPVLDSLISFLSEYEWE